MANDDAAVWDLLAAAVREMEERVDAEFGVGAFQDLGRSWLADARARTRTLLIQSQTCCWVFVTASDSLPPTRAIVLSPPRPHQDVARCTPGGENRMLPCFDVGTALICMHPAIWHSAILLCVPVLLQIVPGCLTS